MSKDGYVGTPGNPLGGLKTAIYDNLYQSEWPKGANTVTNNNHIRISGLKLAYEALTPRIFGTKQPRLNDIKELYELAEYNVRFILDDEINLEYLSEDEKLRKAIDKYK